MVRYGTTIRVIPGKDFDVTIKKIMRLGEGYKHLPKKILPSLAKMFEDSVRSGLPKPGAEKSIRSGHSTPIPIDRFLHRQKLENGYRVFFDPYPVRPNNGVPDDLIMILEKGAHPHIIPVPSNKVGSIEGKEGFGEMEGYTLVQHPGMKGFHMWSKGKAKFIRQYKQDVEQKYSQFINQYGKGGLQMG